MEKGIEWRVASKIISGGGSSGGIVVKEVWKVPISACLPQGIPPTPIFTDTVVFRVAPWIMTPNTLAPVNVFVCRYRPRPGASPWSAWRSLAQTGEVTGREKAAACGGYPLSSSLSSPSLLPSPFPSMKDNYLFIKEIRDLVNKAGCELKSCFGYINRGDRWLQVGGHQKGGKASPPC